MTRMKKAMIWLMMLNKRLYKKPSFVIMLLVIAVMAAVITLFARDDSSMLIIAIYAEEEQTKEILSEITWEKSIISYEFCDTEDDAVNAVKQKGYGAAWIFRENIAAAAKEYVDKGKPMAEAVQRDDTVFMRLAREKLYALLYTYVSHEVYNDFMQENFSGLSQEEAEKIYEKNHRTDKLVEVKFSNSDARIEDVNHITGPLRGMLAIAVFLCAYSALMGFKQDKHKGLFARIPLVKQIYIEAICIFLAASNAAVITLIAIGIGGLFGGILTELFYMLLYVIMCTLFCVLIGELTDRINILGAMLPVLTMLMLVICPVFINTKKAEAFQILLPPYYYLTMFRNGDFLYCGILYICVLAILCIALKKLKKDYL